MRRVGPVGRALLVLVAAVVACDLAIVGFGDGRGDAAEAAEQPGARQQVVAEIRPPSRVPQLPDVAAQPTVEGATRFVRYWFDTLNWSLSQYDTDLLVHHTGAGCRLCSGWLIGIGRWKADGTRLAGGLTYPVSLAVGPFSQGQPVTFAARFATSPAALTDRSGQVRRYPGGVTTGGLTVVYANGRWQMSDIVLDASQSGAAP